MEKERFYYLSSRSFTKEQKTYYIICVLDIIDNVVASVFTSKENFDYFNDTEIMTDISHMIKFHCNNNSNIYHPVLDRKE